VAVLMTAAVNSAPRREGGKETNREDLPVPDGNEKLFNADHGDSKSYDAELNQYITKAYESAMDSYQVQDLNEGHSDKDISVSKNVSEEVTSYEVEQDLGKDIDNMAYEGNTIDHHFSNIGLERTDELEDVIDYDADQESTNEHENVIDHNIKDFESEIVTTIDKLSDNEAGSENGDTTMGDPRRVVDQLSNEIEVFEDMKRKIKYLEEKMRDHADFHLVDKHEISDTNAKLEEVRVKMTIPFKKNLEAVKEQIVSLNHTLDNGMLDYVGNLIKHAEIFLIGAQERLDNIEKSERIWEYMEDSLKTKDMKEKEETIQTPETRFYDENIVEQEEINEETKAQATFRYHTFSNLEKLEDQEKTPVDERKNSNQINFDEVKKQLDRENFIVENLAETDDDPKDVVTVSEYEVGGRRFSPRVKVLLDEAREKSHNFMIEKLNHHHFEEESESTNYASNVLERSQEIHREKWNHQQEESDPSPQVATLLDKAKEKSQEYVQALLDEAKEKSHNFIKEKLRHHEEVTENLSAWWLAALSLLVVVIILFGLVMFHARRSWRRSQLFQAGDEEDRFLLYDVKTNNDVKSVWAKSRKLK